MKLIFTRGLPGSGKSTWAREYVGADPGRRVRVNRDSLRMMLLGQPILDGAGEMLVTEMQASAIGIALRAGKDVVVDDLNLRPRYIRRWLSLANEYGATVEIKDFDIPVEACIARDAQRPLPVGEDIIRAIHQKLVHKVAFMPIDAILKSAKEEPRAEYVPNPHRPRAWIFDLDNTLALHGDRSPYDWSRVYDDTPNEPVAELARTLAARGDCIIVASGREDVCRSDTVLWLTNKARVPFTALYMRVAGDGRADYVVKSELFSVGIAPNYQVLGVFDDRNSVVAMWRRLGLLCAQVAEGDF